MSEKLRHSDWSDLDASIHQGRFIAALDRLREEPIYSQIKSRMKAETCNLGPTDVLDIGCGTGEDTAALGGIRAVGVDLSAAVIEVARKRHPESEFLVGNAACLPFDNESFDVVRADRVLQHVADGQGAVGEIRRVLRPGGTFICSDADYVSTQLTGPPQDQVQRVLAVENGRIAGLHTLGRLKELLVDFGFRIECFDRLPVEYTSLQSADGIYGLTSWGEAASLESALTPTEGEAWETEILTAGAEGRLRFRMDHLYVRAILLRD